MRRVRGSDASRAGESGLILLAACAVAWVCDRYPAALPAWAPWDFSWVEFLSAAFALWWYGRGLSLTPPPARPGPWRRAGFLLGVGVIYAVLQTHFDYLGQHMFFLHRVQHLVMHHLGPFLIALSWPGETLLRGMPPLARRMVAWPPLRRAIHALQQPVLAGVLFVGLIFLWLIPPIHFRAMLDPRLYAVMNWSMVIDGLLFWCLAMDPRPGPPARLTLPARLILVLAVQLPQIAGGAVICFTSADLYAFYNLCGRIFPGIGAGLDQQIGGFIIWFGGGMMSAVAALVIFNRMWHAHDRADGAPRPQGDGLERPAI
jgi:putative membrane protein